MLINKYKDVEIVLPARSRMLILYNQNTGLSQHKTAIKSIETWKSGHLGIMKKFEFGKCMQQLNLGSIFLTTCPLNLLRLYRKIFFPHCFAYGFIFVSHDQEFCC